MENLDFLNLNSLRGFPIREVASRHSVDDRFVLPDDFLVDLIMAVDIDVESRFFISELINLPEQISLTVSNQDGTAVGSFIIVTASHQLYQQYPFTPTAEFAGANAKLVVANLEGLKTQPTGTFTFDIAGTEFETRCILPLPVGITRLVFEDDNEDLFSVSGDVKLLARLNLRFRKEGNTVYLDAGNGLGLNQDCSAAGLAIKTINHIPPTDDGNFNVSFLDCDSIEPTTNGIILSDSCNKPCLGCDEIGQLTDRLVSLESDLLKLRKYFDDLNATAIQLSNLISFNCEA